MGPALLALASSLAHAAGEVTVEVDEDGNLVVRGDDEGNEILIFPVADGEGDVIGLGTTTVNGSDRAAFIGADNDFEIHLRGGDDRVEIDDGDGNEILDDLEVSLGSGDDSLLVRNFFIHDDLQVYMGSGDDTVELSENVFVLDKTDIRTHSGDDVVLFVPPGTEVPLLVFEDEFSLTTGSGDDFVDIVAALFVQEVYVDLGDDDDLGLCVCDTVFETDDPFSDVEFDGGDGEDSAVLESVCGIAPPGVIDDFLDDIEFQPDDCSYLGGVACSRSCL